ncbi:MAG: hypothetical protein NDI61_12835 [Bdellovibrionaceae bacterium]|nr:hypothetical protein [Pseudobdellovibrionaceae bacterium]
MAILAQLASIDNLGILATLEKLAEAYREGRQNPQSPSPFSTLFLKSGLSMRGHILALSADSGPRSVLFLILDPKALEPGDLTYVLVSEIAGVTVHGAAAIVDQLSDGRVARPMGPPPSRGDLTRTLKAMIDELNQIVEGKMAADLNGVPENASAEILNSVSLTIRDLYATLRKLASEELGRQALHEKGFHFSIRVGEEAVVQIQKNQVAISIGVRGAHVERVSRESMRVNIEEFL